MCGVICMVHTVSLPSADPPATVTRSERDCPMFPCWTTTHTVAVDEPGSSDNSSDRSEKPTARSSSASTHSCLKYTSFNFIQK